jgi:cytosine/adenosine deaminase-related metal-dependent hydrolase
MNTPEHADAAVDALRASGLRAVFGHGTPTSDPSWYVGSERRHPDDVRRIAADHFTSDDQLVTLALSVRGPEGSTIDAVADDLALARDLSVRASMHGGLGLLGGQRSITQLYDRNLLGPDLIFFHANPSTDDELKMMADTGGHASVSARVEMMMGHGHPATGRLLAAGVHPALSVDVVARVPSNRRLAQGNGGDAWYETARRGCLLLPSPATSAYELTRPPVAFRYPGAVRGVGCRSRPGMDDVMPGRSAAEDAQRVSVDVLLGPRC